MIIQFYFLPHKQGLLGQNCQMVLSFEQLSKNNFLM